MQVTKFTNTADVPINRPVPRLKTVSSHLSMPCKTQDCIGEADPDPAPPPPYAVQYPVQMLHSDRTSMKFGMNKIAFKVKTEVHRGGMDLSIARSAALQIMQWV